MSRRDEDRDEGGPASPSRSSDDAGAQSAALASAISGIIAALLVAGRSGAPAEGRIPFNPLYFHLLRRIDADGRVRPSVLADDLGVSRTTVSTALKALQGRGLLTTAPDPTDGRAHVAMLTDEGREVLQAIQRQDLRNAEAMLASLDEDERSAFVAAATKVARGLLTRPSTASGPET